MSSKYHSALDSDRFGFNIAKINHFSEPVKNILEELKLNHYKMIISKVDTNNLDQINELESNGFLLKDIQLTYKYELKESLDVNLSSGVTIREAILSDQKRLQEIALQSFENYGHYYADKKLDPNKCRDIYGDWIARSFDKNVADNIIVAEVDGVVAGFLSHKIYNQDVRYAVGGIGAVDSQFRSKDIFKSITIAGINWALLNKCSWVEHNVLINNIPVNRSFIKLGFKLANSMLTFHKWI